MTTLVGALGSSARVTVDPRGRIEPVGVPWAFELWIGADDRWRRFATEAAVRQTRPSAAPVLETAMRVPGGDAVQHVWAVGPHDGVVIMELENRSPGPFVVAVVIEPAGARPLQTLEQVADDIVVDGTPALCVPGPVRRWAAGPESLDALFERVQRHEAGGDRVPAAVASRTETLRAALLFPVPHRARLRFAIPGPDAEPGSAVVTGASPDAAAAARGWGAQLQRGLVVALPDEGLQRAVDAARVEVLLRDARNPHVVRALEDWGFDDEAEAGFRQLSWRDRRVAARRDPPPVDPWGAAFAAAMDDPLALLAAVHAALLRDHDDGSVTILPTWPDDWRGRGIEVHGAPTRSGPVSYALRWHGEHPALLWDVAVPRAVRVPGLAPDWVAHEAVGEVLLR